MIAGGFHVYRFLGLEHDGTALWWWWLGTLVKDFGCNLARADVGASDAMRVFLEVDHVPQGVHPKLNDDIHTHNHHSSGNSEWYLGGAVGGPCEFRDAIPRNRGDVDDQTVLEGGVTCQWVPIMP